MRRSCSAATGSSRAAAPVPSGRSHTGTTSPCARNIPTSLESVDEDVVAGGVQPGEGVHQRRLGVRAAPSAGAPWARRRPSTPPRRRSAGPTARPRRRPARAPRPSRRPGRATSSSHHSKPWCTVISSGSSVTRSCRRTPAPGGSTSPTTPGSSVASAFSSTAAEVTRGVAERVPDLEAQPDLAAVAHHRRRRHRQQRAEGDGAVADPERGGGGRHELAQRHQVALGGQPLEGPDHERAAGRAVARLVALARPARARLARPDARRRRAPGHGPWCGSASPCSRG